MLQQLQPWFLPPSITTDCLLWCMLQVGSGGYSDVHRALLRDQVVAAKVLRVGTATSKVLSSLQHEAYVMSLMRHPNITPFYGGQPGNEEPLAGCMLSVVLWPALAALVQLLRGCFHSLACILSTDSPRAAADVERGNEDAAHMRHPQKAATQAPSTPLLLLPQVL
jgi:hypothetical protein